MARLTILLFTLALLGGCQLFELERQMQAARQELVLVPGHLRASAANRPALIALLDAQDKPVAYRIVAPGESFYFNVAPASYQLLAFDDGNGNFILDTDEPRHWQPQARSVPLATQPDASTRERLMQHNPLSLASDDLAPAPALDLSMAVLYREHPRLRSNYLQQVDLDDPRFAPPQVSLGAWQPLTFIREIGYGFYLLAPWDAQKEPVFLVHGINSSPDVWRELVDSFDPQRFQLVLFHYPSGVPLNNSAYMLSEGIRDIQLRHAEALPRVRPQHGRAGGTARRAAAGEQRRNNAAMPVLHPVHALGRAPFRRHRYSPCPGGSPGVARHGARQPVPAGAVRHPAASAHRPVATGQLWQQQPPDHPAQRRCGAAG